MSYIYEYLFLVLLPAIFAGATALGVMGVGVATEAQAHPGGPLPQWCPGEWWDPGWGNNWDWGNCHDWRGGGGDRGPGWDHDHGPGGATGTMGPAGQATHIPVAGGDLTKPGTH